jgi:enoyl-CoA hydratase
MAVTFEIEERVAVITIDRPGAKNAVDGPTARELADAFRRFEKDEGIHVAVLTGAKGTFCAGADLKGIGTERQNRVESGGDGPMGPTRMLLEKPVIAAIEGYAVAGGLELACFCDLRIAARSAVLGVLCRRVGVPLIDGGTVRLPRLIGLSRALDLILTGRAVGAEEALSFGLVNRVVDDGQALPEAMALAKQLAALPQTCMRNDRLAAYEQHDLPLEEALEVELRRGLESLASPEMRNAVGRFVGGAGRHGERIDELSAPSPRSRCSESDHPPSNDPSVASRPSSPSRSGSASRRGSCATRPGSLR